MCTLLYRLNNYTECSRSRKSDVSDRTFGFTDDSQFYSSIYSHLCVSLWNSLDS